MPRPGPGGALDSVIYLRCARRSRLWCRRHNQAHLGIAGTSKHFCGECLRAGIKLLRDTSCLERFRQELPVDAYDVLRRMCEKSAKMYRHLSTGTEHWAKWLVVIEALLRDPTNPPRRQKLLAIIEEVIATEDISILLPFWAIEQYEED